MLDSQMKSFPKYSSN